MKVMIVVTHLLGTGHLARALTLGRAFVAAGHDVHVISGGRPVDHFDTAGMTLVQLPPVASDGVDFATLLDMDGAPVSPDTLHARARQLADLVPALRPDVILTELFPFGRHILRAEFHALLDAAQTQVPRPLLLCSVRDILAPPGKPRKVTFAADLIDRIYDAVLVHSDPDIVPLDHSWPVDDRLAAHLRYTGFVAPASPPKPGVAHGDILVSTGGGAVGDRVFTAACDAARLTTDRPWRLLVGGDDTRRAALATDAPPNVIVEAPRPDFRTLLQGASVSISMCGYNTALDVLQTGVAAVFVPFDDGNEVEQGLRAAALGALPGIVVAPQSTLDGPTLAAHIHALHLAPPRAPRIAGMDGAARTVEIAAELWAERSR